MIVLHVPRNGIQTYLDTPADWPRDPGYDRIKEFLTRIEPSFAPRNFEHVNVWFNNRRADMFVDEIGRLKGLPVNDYATQAYRAGPAGPRHDGLICGPAIIFDGRIWF